MRLRSQVLLVDRTPALRRALGVLLLFAGLALAVSAAGAIQAIEIASPSAQVW